MIELEMDVLPEKQRQLWTMRYRYGSRRKTISLKLGLSEGGVFKMLAREHKTFQGSV